MVHSRRMYGGHLGLIRGSKMSEDLKDMLERTFWTFVSISRALVVAPLAGVEAETLQLAALAGGGAALAVVKTYAKNKSLNR